MNNMDAIKALQQKLNEDALYNRLTGRKITSPWYKHNVLKYRLALLYAIKALRDGVWTPISERLPEEKINPRTNDFEYVVCSTVWGDIRPYKYGKPKGHDKPHFWLCGGIMDEYVIAWQELPEPYKEGGAAND